jgi:hypothetical protein
MICVEEHFTELWYMMPYITLCRHYGVKPTIITLLRDEDECWQYRTGNVQRNWFDHACIENIAQNPHLQFMVNHGMVRHHTENV